jgi:hypothetical protein
MTYGNAVVKLILSAFPKKYNSHWRHQLITYTTHKFGSYFYYLPYFVYLIANPFFLIKQNKNSPFIQTFIDDLLLLLILFLLFGRSSLGDHDPRHFSVLQVEESIYYFIPSFTEIMLKNSFLQSTQVNI